MTTVNREKLVWHYTNASGLLGIIQGKQLWATHFQFMNDFMEGSLLAQSLRRFIESDAKLSSNGRSTLLELHKNYGGEPREHVTRVPIGNRFLLCGSTRGDELTLWRNYAQEPLSYSVGLDPSAPLGVIPPRGNLRRNSRNRVNPWTQVDYRSQNENLPGDFADKLRNAANHGYMEDVIGDAADALHWILSVVKSKAFMDERETRVISQVEDPNLWRFRPGRFGITPYIALGSSNQWGKNSTGEDVLPIRAIRLSSNATSADRLALNALLESNGFKGLTETIDFVDDSGHVTPIISSQSAPPVQIFQSSHSLR